MLSNRKHVEKSPSSVVVVVECLLRMQGDLQGQVRQGQCHEGRDQPRQHDRVQAPEQRHPGEYVLSGIYEPMTQKLVP